MTADAERSAMDMAGVDADDTMEAVAAGGEDAADLSAFLPPTPTDAAALTVPACATLMCCAKHVIAAVALSKMPGVRHGVTLLLMFVMLGAPQNAWAGCPRSMTLIACACLVRPQLARCCKEPQRC